jgi:hypothetical protein
MAMYPVARAPALMGQGRDPNHFFKFQIENSVRKTPHDVFSQAFLSVRRECTGHSDNLPDRLLDFFPKLSA